jgi:DNA adenine methylase
MPIVNLVSPPFMAMRYPFCGNNPGPGKNLFTAIPPYLMETRSYKQPIYSHEFNTPQQHEQLLSLLLAIPCQIAISGYWSSLYASMLATWRTINYQAITRSGRQATEWLWMNYPEPVELHDYRYLGDNFRQRERIKRIKTRWAARLARMDRLERYAILSTINTLSDSGSEFVDRAPTK